MILGRLKDGMKGQVGDFLIATLSLFLILASLFFAYTGRLVPTPEQGDEVAEFVTEFGTELEQIPLSEGTEVAKAAMEARYKLYVSPDLLALWETDLSSAPGRVDGKPRPVGIRVSSVQNVGIGSYVVRGYILHESEDQKVEGDRVILGIDRAGDRWEIIEYQTVPAH